MTRFPKLDRRDNLTLPEKRNLDMDIAITDFEASDSVTDAIAMLRIARDLYDCKTYDLKTYLGYVNDTIDCEERNRCYPRAPEKS